MNYILNALEVSVDSGTILISDDNFYDKNCGDIDENIDFSVIKEVDNGKYKVRWRIKNTWNGDISGEEIIEVKSERIIITDPCYHFDNHNWDKVLNKYNFFEIPPDDCIVINEMGGDGTYNVEINLEEIY